ncbi:MAG: hypothetical protein ACRDN0_08975 [Trebonia sp.]
MAQHIAKMLRRTGASNRTDLVNRAYRIGILPRNIQADSNTTQSYFE